MKTVQRVNPSKQRSKNTSCPFFLTVKVKKQASKTTLKRAQRKLINIQPAAVQRRKNKNGTKKRVKWGGNSKISSNIPVPMASRKRTHELSKNIGNNVMSTKKHSRDMKSRCRPVLKKKQSNDK